MIGASPSLGSSQQQKRGVAHQRAGDRQHLLLAARQPAGDPVAQRLQQRKDVVDAPDRPLVLAAGPLLLPDDEVVLDGVLGKYLAVFRHEAEPGLGDTMRF